MSWATHVIILQKDRAIRAAVYKIESRHAEIATTSVDDPAPTYVGAVQINILIELERGGGLNLPDCGDVHVIINHPGSVTPVYAHLYQIDVVPVGDKLLHNLHLYKGHSSPPDVPFFPIASVKFSERELKQLVRMGQSLLDRDPEQDRGVRELIDREKNTKMRLRRSDQGAYHLDIMMR